MALLLWIVPIVLQIICVVHVIRTGRTTTWIFIIIFLSVIGCAIYFFVEILPGMLNSYKTRKMGAVLLDSLAPTRKIKMLEDQCLLADTTANRHELADEYLKCGFYGKAIEQYKKCLVGLNKDDSYILCSLAKAYYHHQDYREAIAIYQKILPGLDSTLSRESRLIYIYALEKSGLDTEAEKEYRQLLAASTNLEAMYHFALFLKNRKQPDAARQLFREIVLISKRTPAFNARENRQWINAAKSELGQGKM